MYPIQIPVLGIGFEYLFERLSPQDNSQEHSCSTSLILTVVVYVSLMILKPLYLHDNRKEIKGPACV